MTVVVGERVELLDCDRIILFVCGTVDGVVGNILFVCGTVDGVVGNLPQTKLMLVYYVS